jgi:hypothetical protein
LRGCAGRASDIFPRRRTSVTKHYRFFIQLSVVNSFVSCWILSNYQNALPSLSSPPAFSSRAPSARRPHLHSPAPAAPRTGATLPDVGPSRRYGLVPPPVELAPSRALVRRSDRRSSSRLTRPTHKSGHRCSNAPPSWRKRIGSGGETAPPPAGVLHGHHRIDMWWMLSRRRSSWTSRSTWCRRRSSIGWV